MRMTRTFGPLPCDSGTSGRPSEVILYQGEFSCPSLVGAGAKTIKIDNAKFSCGQALSASSCGGGGGGGTPPPTF